MQTIETIKEMLKTSPEYETFRTSDKVKNGLHILCLSGSYAYGTNREDSDVDIRGVTSLAPYYANGYLSDWEVKSFSETDTTIYSYRKLIRMLSKGNPDTLGIVGQDIDKYFVLSDLGKELIEKHSDFIGADGVYSSFIGYANAQMRRLELAELGRLTNKKELAKEIKTNILTNAMFNMHTKYQSVETDNMNIKFKVPNDFNEDIILESVSAKNISMNDFFDVAKDFKHIVSSFGDKGKRNTKKTDFKLNKHCMHTVRGMLMGIECLETGRVRTYREKDLPLLKSILNGEWMLENGKMKQEFYELIEKLRKEALYAYKNTVLPRVPDEKKVSDMMTEFVLYDLKK